MKGFPLQPAGKGLGVCSKGVLKQPSSLTPACYNLTKEIKCLRSMGHC